jgi:hypothetical protein
MPAHGYSELNRILLRTLTVRSAAKNLVRRYGAGEQELRRILSGMEAIDNLIRGSRAVRTAVVEDIGLGDSYLL